MVTTSNTAADGARQQKLLVVDDEDGIAEIVGEIAQRAGFCSRYTSNPNEFPSLYSSDLDVIIIDLVMPGVDGVELIRSLANKRYQGALILMSGLDPKVLQCARELALESGLTVAGHVSKPFRSSELTALLSQIRPRTAAATNTVGGDLISVPELLMGMRQGEITSYYQPKINLKTGQFSGVEALVRWCHPLRGVIAPDEFLPIAESAGLMDRLTWIIVQDIFVQIGKWGSQDFFPKVSINFSASVLSDLAMPEKLDEFARRAGVAVSQISIEVTESAPIEELADALDSLIRLRMKGIGVSLDDFGTGYSSFTQLRSMPFNELKIDRSFVAAACHEHEARSIVETTVSLGHRLGLNVVAEGIESEEIIDLLRKLGCHDGQGYYFGKPMPGNKLSEWLTRLNESLSSGVI